jgi:hypothetical protein
MAFMICLRSLFAEQALNCSGAWFPWSPARNLPQGGFSSCDCYFAGAKARHVFLSRTIAALTFILAGDSEGD